MKWYFVVPISATISFLLGFFWYSPALFGKSWEKAAGVKGKTKGRGMLMPSLVSFFILNLMAYGMYWLMAQAGIPKTYAAGLRFGCIVGACFTVTSSAIDILYQQQSITLWLINAPYKVLCTAITGALWTLLWK